MYSREYFSPETMTRKTHGHRLMEWADLVGASVPDSVADDGDEPTLPAWDDADVERR
ncbi:hypothetical protein C499_11541 [Halogeometricum borinquense DSM 11551]|uniref:Uncharacterized protein n=1 Tax=Halogeometricum borinquense (strain ATCC 700274 / DSM 11551 / JCM 10706 / KCTC 4070 / PR3) TaxID=469382 RepID=E4NSU7_HALBP|nr:hypothetical protein Hbor_02250 [Halogeometricum borinquense DSM 11551]ELY26837.1 hypothetical protein C499_11541 [Halogeometricum borinquense DSM 11551]